MLVFFHQALSVRCCGQVLLLSVGRRRPGLYSMSVTTSSPWPVLKTSVVNHPMDVSQLIWLSGCYCTPKEIQAQVEKSRLTLFVATKPHASWQSLANEQCMAGTVLGA